ncbi:aldo/keto reductase [Mycoplasmatota bacterium]|nr:aldo/keto reductase [Mycoplasmatota bacterium]
MKKVQMKSDVNNSLLGFGCMRFPTKNGKIDRELSTKMLEYAYQNGVTHFDTAYPYHEGESELFLGEFLKKLDRNSFTLSTKLPVWKVEKYEDFEAYLDEQLNKLQVDYFDFYLLHALNKNTWKKIKELDVFKFIEEARAKGKFRYIGFSYHDDKETYQEIGTSYDWDFCLQQINYVDYKSQQGVEGYQLMADRNIPIWVMEPLKGGQLTTLPEDIMNEFKTVKPDDSSVEWAFRWIHSLPGVKLILSGMSTLEQVEENVKIFDKIEPLNENEFKAIDRVRDMLNKRVKIACTGCNYCMPCPQGIQIPRNFKIYNNTYMYNNLDSGKFAYKHYLKEEEKAVNCIECGECLTKCPQQLEIPTLLHEVVDNIGE